MKILILASSFSGLCQRVLRELTCAGHSIDQHYGLDENLLRQQLERFQPDLVVCPFLTHRIPSDIWQAYVCLIVHPGIEGDRGPSSLDWAISEQSPYWGVTLLQAAAEMDAGDIWGTEQFPLRPAGKTSIYKREVSQAAVNLIIQAIAQKQQNEFTPRPLEPNNPKVKGRLRALMRQSDRHINWAKDSTDRVMAKLRAADTSPGIADVIAGYPVHLYGAILEPNLRGEPGELLAIRFGSVCRATTDGAVWIRQLKCCSHPALPGIKLPADRVLSQLLTFTEFQTLCEQETSDHANDIKVEVEQQIAYIHFNFYNGAANTEQCLRLQQAIFDIKQQDHIKTLVLMGGDDFFSNGIQLNCIEAAESPAQESWANINAIDDLVYEIIDSPKHLTIAALRNNAGAGGAILALACDQVIIRDGVVLNPHYAKMGLFGSEYWTYLLPNKVGDSLAASLTRSCEPVLAKEALVMGYADLLLSEDWDTYHRELKSLVVSATHNPTFDEKLIEKNARRQSHEARKPLAEYREHELKKMHQIFFEESSRYHFERRNFVYKGKIPVHSGERAIA